MSAKENIPIDDMEEPRHSLKVWEWYNQNSQEYAMHVPATVMSELCNAGPASYYKSSDNFVCDALCAYAFYSVAIHSDKEHKAMFKCYKICLSSSLSSSLQLCLPLLTLYPIVSYTKERE